MGAACGCGGIDNSMASLKGLSMEEKANVGADRIKKEKYTGLLYSFCEVAADLTSEDIVFATGRGPFPHFCTGARITARTPGNGILVNNN